MVLVYPGQHLTGQSGPHSLAHEGGQVDDLPSGLMIIVTGLGFSTPLQHLREHGGRQSSLQEARHPLGLGSEFTMIETCFGLPEQHLIGQSGVHDLAHVVGHLGLLYLLCLL